MATAWQALGSATITICNADRGSCRRPAVRGRMLAAAFPPAASTSDEGATVGSARVPGMRA
jgi:hypothetical protein